MSRAGVRAILRRAWDRWAPEWFAYAMSLTHERAEAEDLVSEVLLRTIEANPDLRTSRDARNYVVKAIRNRFYALRARRRARRRLISALARENVKLESSLLQLAVTASDKQRRQHRAKLIYEHLRKLPIHQRQALQLYFLVEPTLTYREIALLQNVSPSTVHERVQTALASLAKALKADTET